MRNRTRWGAASIALLLVFLFHDPRCATLFGKDPKLTPEEVVSKHLESLGKPEAVQKVRSRVINGTATATIQVGGAGMISGKASILSSGSQTRIGMAFPMRDYPGEQFAFDGNRVTAGTIQPGVRSALTSFVYQNDALLKEGIVGGVLATAWPLLALPVRQPRLSYGGLQKVEGKACHTLRYKPRKGGMDVEVVLYFEPETFRHVRTESRLTVGAQMASNINESARQQERRFKLVEEYSDFREEDGLMLPHTYRLQFTGDTQERTLLSTWVLTLDQFVHNQDIQPSYFNLQ